MFSKKNYSSPSKFNGSQSYGNHPMEKTPTTILMQPAGGYQKWTSEEPHTSTSHLTERTSIHTSKTSSPRPMPTHCIQPTIQRPSFQSPKVKWVQDSSHQQHKGLRMPRHYSTLAESLGLRYEPYPTSKWSETIGPNQNHVLDCGKTESGYYHSNKTSKSCLFGEQLTQERHSGQSTAVATHLSSPTWTSSKTSIPSYTTVSSSMTCPLPTCLGKRSFTSSTGISQDPFIADISMPSFQPTQERLLPLIKRFKKFSLMTNLGPSGEELHGHSTSPQTLSQDSQCPTLDNHRLKSKRWMKYFPITQLESPNQTITSMETETTSPTTSYYQPLSDREELAQLRDHSPILINSQGRDWFEEYEFTVLKGYDDDEIEARKNWHKLF